MSPQEARWLSGAFVSRLMLYEDNHPLNHVPVEMDNLINSALWFLQHTV
jgi:hypothetical protein